MLYLMGVEYQYRGEDADGNHVVDARIIGPAPMPDYANEAEQGIRPRLRKCRFCKMEVMTRRYTDALGQSARVMMPHGNGWRLSCRKFRVVT